MILHRRPLGKIRNRIYLTKKKTLLIPGTELWIIRYRRLEGSVISSAARLDRTSDSGLWQRSRGAEGAGFVRPNVRPSHYRQLFVTEIKRAKCCSANRSARAGQSASEAKMPTGGQNASERPKCQREAKMPQSPPAPRENPHQACIARRQNAQQTVAKSSSNRCNCAREPPSSRRPPPALVLPLLQQLAANPSPRLHPSPASVNGRKTFRPWR